LLYFNINISSQEESDDLIVTGNVVVQSSCFIKKSGWSSNSNNQNGVSVIKSGNSVYMYAETTKECIGKKISFLVYLVKKRYLLTDKLELILSTPEQIVPNTSKVSAIFTPYVDQEDKVNKVSKFKFRVKIIDETSSTNQTNTTQNITSTGNINTTNCFYSEGVDNITKTIKINITNIDSGKLVKSLSCENPYGMSLYCSFGVTFGLETGKAYKIDTKINNGFIIDEVDLSGWNNGTGFLINPGICYSSSCSFVTNNLPKASSYYLSALSMYKSKGIICSDSTLKTQCNDKIDNDKDGKIDYPNDVNCFGTYYNSESWATTQCSNNLDNDGDKLKLSF